MYLPLYRKNANMSNSTIVKSITFVFLINFLGKILGFIRDLFHARALGTSAENDAYFLSYTISYVAVTIILVTVNTTIVPIISNKKSKSSRVAIEDNINNFYTLVILISILLSAVGYAMAPIIVRFSAQGFDEKIFQLSVELCKIMFLACPFVALVALNNSQLQLAGRYYLNSFTSYTQSFFIILACLMAVESYGVYSLAVANFLGWFTAAILTYIALNRSGFKYRIYINMKDDTVIEALRLLIPVIIGTIIQQADILITRAFASGLDEGSLSALSYASRLTLFEISLVTYAISLVCYPVLSAQIAAEDVRGFSSTLFRALELNTLAIAPISAIFIVLREPIVRVLLQYGKFDSNSTELTATTLGFLSIGLVALGIREIFNKAFYSIRDTKSPMFISTLAIILNIGLCLVLIRVMELPGLALSYSISTILLVIMLGYQLKRKIGDYGIRSIILNKSKILIAAFAMGVFCKVFYDICFIVSEGYSRKIELGVIAGVTILSFFVYLVILYLLRIDSILNVVRSKSWQKYMLWISNANRRN